jgi:hypothetical protein
MPYYCAVCETVMYTPEEASTLWLCWPCAVMWDGGVRLRSSVTFPAIPEWPRETIALVTTGTEHNADWWRQWREIGQQLLEHIAK